MRQIFLLLAFVAIGSLEAPAALIVSASSGDFSVNGNSVDFGDATVMRAAATAAGITTFGTGPLKECNLCANAPAGIGRSEANGTTGTLRAAGGASVSGPGDGSGSATILDTITFRSANPQIKVTLNGEISASNDPNAYATMVFRIFIPGIPGDESSPEETLFELYAYEQDGDRTHSISGPMAGQYAVDMEAGIPDQFEFILDVPPLLLLLNDSLALGFELSAGGGADTDTVFAFASYDNSAYLSILGEYESENGYGYLGEPGGPGTPVPEPQTGALVLAGLGVAFLVRRSHSQ